jgi:hypothetical protein
MKILLFFLYIFFPLKPNASMPSMEEVRRLYVNAASDEISCNKLIGLLSQDGIESNSLLLGYKGCAEMMKAKYGFNPFSKFSYFKKGKSMLEKAIVNDAGNIELRYLRFAVQINAPVFLGYRKNIQEDKIFLLNAIKNISDVYLKQSVISILKNSDYVSKEEKIKL